jgi:CheY-like chemotaxis protein
LLTFAKGGAPVRAAVMLPDVVREVAEFALHGSDVCCEFSIPPGLWPADVDKGQIGQVVQNIVINARQAMPQGGRIEIALRNDIVGAGDGVLAPGRYLRMTISDAGAGIPEEDLARIFEPYFTTKKNGSGLGLATVYSIVKKHHGRVTAESGAGRGTTFNIWLPAAGETTAREAEPLEQGPPEASDRRRVLFMDDDVEVRRVGEAMLQRLGHAVTGVADGAAAVAEYRRALEGGPRYDLVILDLTVPGGMGGRQAMEQLRKLDPSVKAIVSSGYSNDQALANHHEHGFLGRVAKPYELSDLARTIADVLRRERN